MYVAVKGGEKAIDNAHALMRTQRRGDTAIAELSVDQIRQQLPLAVDRIMNEGSVYDPELAALALKQASGDAVEAIFLLRAYRTTLPRFGYSEPLDTEQMQIERRISGTFKDLPGGQILGSTYDYTHRLLDFSLLASGEAEVAPAEANALSEALAAGNSCPRVLELLNKEGLIEQSRETGDGDQIPRDLTREPVNYPAERAVRLQNLMRGDEGFLLSLSYASMRGYGDSHPFSGEMRTGRVSVELVPEELGFPIEIGEVLLTESEMVNQFHGSKDLPPQFTRGYGIAFGRAERKAMSVALVERALRAEELGEEVLYPTQDQEFVLSHTDCVSANGFVSHLKLPHYVDFQSELEMIRRLRKEQGQATQSKTTNEEANA
ncbi:MAG: carbon-phosphorus lyase complex subunit PhnI [Oceanospirillales bacterium]|uniref:Alpha-D-ribose 1-methylphosphonate 5-triphosphate synthase subunit PhnI n=1 Tax=Marinobacterium halophilum TaxID=267374 RepID=A0A2P8F3F6_9GAMM|nr:carbon-phosphorus lyase complex subunit PhnI [Marinobacterium halophilum]MBR9827529.1 carbon-phosphorus lyase complex subunit PhnI [Oceanospirillales bacterium]PSL16226.1 alpha-D-ribose 1-methylphosphonate 5-triphosphate synthase subunit PhnI [Marinobacterium halophilum]